MPQARSRRPPAHHVEPSTSSRCCPGRSCQGSDATVKTLCLVGAGAALLRPALLGACCPIWLSVRMQPCRLPSAPDIGVMAATSETWQQDDHRGVIFQLLHSNIRFIT